LSPSRYYRQKLYHLKRQDYRRLAQLKWCSEKALEAKLNEICISHSEPLVPKQPNGYLRIKVVDESEARELSNARGFERVQSQCGSHTHFFGYEPMDLADPKALGFVVSIWRRKDKRVAENVLSYDFGRGLILIFRSGNDRGLAERYGLQTFFKNAGRFSVRPHPSGAVAEEEIGYQQYWNQKFGCDGMNAYYRPFVNTLTNVSQMIAQEVNPLFMTMVGHNCCMGLVTTGYVPSFPEDWCGTSGDSSVPTLNAKRKSSQQSLQLKKKSKPAQHALQGQPAPLDEDSLNDDKSMRDDDSVNDTGHYGDCDSDCDSDNASHSSTKPHPAPHPLASPTFTKGKMPQFRKTATSTPPIGVVITSHVDKGDKLAKDQMQEWSEEAVKKNWTYCQRLLKNPLFCLPTTCCYQWCFNGATIHRELQVNAHFSMEGLGLAMRLQHCTSHHFLGGAFTHNTSIASIRRYSDGFVSCTNSEDKVLIVAWGGFGGRKEVKQRKQQRQVAPIVTDLTARLAADTTARLASEAKVARLEQQLEEVPAVVANLNAKLAASDARVAMLEKRLADAGLL
jgi:hypothetical protein